MKRQFTDDIFKRENSPIVNYLVSKYQQYIYATHEPLAEIQAAAYAMQTVNTHGPGRTTIHIAKSKKLQQELLPPPMTLMYLLMDLPLLKQRLEESSSSIIYMDN